MKMKINLRSQKHKGSLTLIIGLFLFIILILIPFQLTTMALAQEGGAPELDVGDDASTAINVILLGLSNAIWNMDTGTGIVPDFLNVFLPGIGGDVGGSIIFIVIFGFTVGGFIVALVKALD